MTVDKKLKTKPDILSPLRYSNKSLKYLKEMISLNLKPSEDHVSSKGKTSK